MTFPPKMYDIYKNFGIANFIRHPYSPGDITSYLVAERCENNIVILVVIVCRQ